MSIFAQVLILLGFCVVILALAWVRNVCETGMNVDSNASRLVSVDEHGGKRAHK